MSESFAQRLARLRRETPRASTDANAPEERESPVPAAELDDLKRRRVNQEPPSHARSVGDPEGLAALPGARDVGVRVDRRPLEARHGNGRFEHALQAPPPVLARAGLDEALVELDPRRAVYLDIETTGLAGGAGTYPFLVALGTFEEEAFVVRQLFLESPAGERDLVAHVAEVVARSSGLVSFFGKSFDRHRLEDKMRLHGVQPPFEPLPHLDLYHPCRRLYGRCFGDGRLQTLERALLGFEREDDLSGAFAPAAWFDHQAGRPHLLEAVFLHNLLDVHSLALLLAHVGDCERERDPDGRPLAGPPLVRARGWARIAARLRDREAQERWLVAALERCDASEVVARELELELADVQRRAGRLDEARATLEGLLAGQDRCGALAEVELGKLLARRKVTRDEGRAHLVRARTRAMHVLGERERERVLTELDRRLRGPR